jgi:hypothetical protein
MLFFMCLGIASFPTILFSCHLELAFRALYLGSSHGKIARTA